VVIGRGTFATVFSATYLGEPAAVKVLHMPAGVGAEHIEKVFSREAEIHYTLRHECIVPLLGVCVDKGTGGAPEYALVMPLLKGNLESALSGGGGGLSPTLPQRLSWLRSIAKGLAFLHAQGIVHGDLKPGNVLVDSGGRAALCDFGGSRVGRGDESSLSIGAGMGGTPRYKDPAVASGRNAQRKASDVYSFGILAWQVVTGRVPFEGMDPAALVSHTVGGGRPDVKLLPTTGLPAGFQFLLGQCWLDAQQDRPTAIAVCAKLG
jgi:serine/threonine-protein kinase